MNIKILPIILGLLFFWPSLSAASLRGEVRQGNRLYQKGDYKRAAEKFDKALQKKSESDIINFDLGTAEYKKKEYPQAIAHLQKALLSEDAALRARASYNLGNALVKFGLSRENDNIEQAIQSLQQALVQYENVLKADAKDADAVFNHEFTKKELERLQKQKQQQQNKQCPRPEKQNQDQGQQPKPDSGQEEKPPESAEGRDKDYPENQSGTSSPQENGKTPEKPAPPDQSRPESGAVDSKPQKFGEEQPDKNSDQQSTPGYGKSEKLTEQEARMLLDDYQKKEEPRGLLNFQPKSAEERPVAKDW